MIDFKNAAFLKLKPVDDKAFLHLISPMLTDGEFLIGTYQGLRDGVIFTNKRLIAVNVQGITGKKKDFTSLPYSKIQAFSVETAGVLDYDSELDLWFSGLGHVRFEFVNTTNIAEICKLISERVL